MSGQTENHANKTLCNMPPEMWKSALMCSPGFLPESFRRLGGLVRNTLALSARFAYLIVVVWVVMWLLPVEFMAGFVPAARLASTLYLGAVFVGCVAYRVVFELEGWVPRKDREYPLVSVASTIPKLLSTRDFEGYPLSWVALLYSGLLWLSWWNGWQATPSAWHTLGFAAVTTAIGMAAHFYGRRLPFHGYRRPSEDDLAAWHSMRTRVAQLRAQADSPAAQEYATPVEARPARLKFSDIHGMATVKKQMLEAGTQILQARRAGEPPRNGLLLHGEPGNGKTAFADALAGELGVPVVALTYGDVASKWLGEMPRVISNCFRYAQQQAPCVLFLDEVDSFLRTRDGVTSGEDIKITNTLLTEMVSLRDHPVVLVAATNYLASLDPAAVREGRFDFKVEITAPDEQARIGLLEAGAARHLPQVSVDREALLSIARRWAGFSVSRLLAVVKALAGHLSERGARQVGFDDWMAALRLVQGRKGRVPSSAKRLEDLVLQTETRDALHLIAHRLRDVHRVEALGGTLPGGILFHGPSGTGKTIAAQSLALESGWAFLSVAGPDLVAERDRITTLYREACDLRPTLVFIDEADDLLRDRQFSATPEPVNRLLALMDGSERRITDVVFVAATNNPDQVDPALRRAGRFTEKVAFYPPSADQILTAVEKWLRTRNVGLSVDLDVGAIGEMLLGATIADVEGVLQYALNCAIARDPESQRAVLCRADLDAAVKVVAP